MAKAKPKGRKSGLAMVKPKGRQPAQKPAKKPGKKPAQAPGAGGGGGGAGGFGAGAASRGPAVRVRMYRQGLGDCFLLTFGVGGDERHMLIDCGTLGSTTNPKNKLKAVVADIGQTVRPTGASGERLTVLVATHEHQDHLSGFNSQAEAIAALRPRHVWLAWTENPGNDDAVKLLKYKTDLAMAVGAAIRAAPLDRKGPDGNPTRAAEAALAARDVMAFAGDPGALGADKFAETVDAAMKFVRDGLGVQPTYHKPGKPPVELPEVPGFRFYVLGPPTDRQVLGQLGEHGSSHLFGLRAAAVARGAARSKARLTAAQKEDCEREMPFDTHHRIGRKRGRRAVPPGYYDRDEAWRQVDENWLDAASDLALQLDSLTNNTSLALAIERIADGRVLLFPADAQEGNWLSWHDENMKWTVQDGGGVTREVTAADLLARTVFYKAGHHCSHNATVNEGGLGEMNRRDELTCFIPVDRQVALGRNPKDKWQMPARPLYRALLERCEGRVARSDVGWASAAAPGDAVEQEFDGMATAAEWKRWAAEQAAAVNAGKVKVNPLFIDYTLA